jgi:membrane dipeptidase
MRSDFEIGKKYLSFAISKAFILHTMLLDLLKNFSRRDFIRASLALAASLPLWESISFGSGRKRLSDVFADVFDRGIVLDGHSTPFYLGLPAADDAVWRAIKESGLTVVKATAMDPGKTLNQVHEQIALYRKIAAQYPQRVMIVERLEDFNTAQKKGSLGLILSGEDASMLGKDLGHIKVLRAKGLRSMQLTYHYKTQFGDGCIAPSQGGLTPLGRDAAELMNELGVTIDCSHACKKTTAEIIERSKKAVIISHTGCNAIYRNPRNNDDQELRATADKGGVVGIYLMSWFLSPGPENGTAEDFYRHLVHALKVCGEESVGIGTDHPIEAYPLSPEIKELWAKGVRSRLAAGTAVPGENPNRWAMIPELHRNDRMQVIADNLAKRGFSSRVVENLMGRNFYRVFRDTWS